MRRHERNRRYNQRTDSLGRTLGPPSWYKRKKKKLGYGRSCDCNLEEYGNQVKIVKSESFPTYSDGLAEAQLRECPECGKQYVYDRWIVEG